MNKILISIPAKDEELMIGFVIEQSREAVKQHIGVEPIVLVINDGSKDKTSQIAESFGAIVKNHKKSHGLGSVFAEAVDYAIEHDFEIMLTIDGDGQFDTKDIPNLLKPILKDEADFVTGSRFLEQSKVSGIPKTKYIGNKLMSRLISSILKQSFTDVSCGFRVYSREALLHLNIFSQFTYTHEVFLNLGVKKIRIVEIPISVKYFKERVSRIASSLYKYAIQTTKIIFKSVLLYKPMRLFGFISFITGVIGSSILGLVTIRYALTDLITPFKGIAIVSIILIIISFGSFSTGIILEIMSRIQLSIEKNIYYARKK